MTVLITEERRVELIGQAAANVLSAFGRNPTLAWTPVDIAEWYGLKVAAVSRAIDELAAVGIIEPGRPGTYVLARHEASAA